MSLNRNTEEGRRSQGRRGFTLIELLIVVAIIAILAAIAVPNFLEAQVRAKVSRCKADMRTMATALEAYQVDENEYPEDLSEWWNEHGDTTQNQLTIMFPLTTPVNYISEIPPDPFAVGGTIETENPGQDWFFYTFYYDHPDDGPHPGSTRYLHGTAHEWVLTSYGPSKTRAVNSPQGRVWPGHILMGLPGWADGPYYYDPTNGTMSFGVIQRTNVGFIGGEHWPARNEMWPY